MSSYLTHVRIELIRTIMTLVAVMWVITVFLPVSAQVLVTQRCGKEVVSLPVTSRLWLGSKQPLSATQIEQLQIVNLKNIVVTGTLGYAKVAQSGQAIAYFMRTGTTMESLRLVVRRENGVERIFIPAQNWIRLGPEISPGHFGVFAYNPDSLSAILVDIDYQTETAPIGRVSEELGFQVNFDGGSSYRDHVDISPDWTYVGYISNRDSSITSTLATTQYVIHSRANRQPIATVDLMGEIPLMAWASDTRHVGTVLLRNDNLDSPILLITPDGRSKRVFHVSDLPLTKPVILGFSTQMSGNNIALDAVPQDNGQNNKHYILNVDSREIVEFCIDSEMRLSLGEWVEDGKYLSYVRFSRVTGLPDGFVLLEVATGNYSIYELQRGQVPLGWSK